MQRPTGSSHPSIVLAVVTTAGGVQGFVKQKSKASLIAGLTLGAAFAGSAALINSGKHVEGHTVSLAASFVMLGAMAPRFIRSKKIWPAGVCTVLGGANVPYQYFKTRQWMDT